MINIVQKQTVKLPGQSSLFVSFKYDEQVVSVLKQYSPCVWNSKEKTWEVPTTYLSSLLDSLCMYDSIQLSLLPTKDTKIEEPTIDVAKYKSTPFQH